MQYVMLIYLDSKHWSELSTDERNRVHQECGAWHDALVKSGHSRNAVGLQSISAAKTLREAGGQIVISEGPFAKTREVLSGFETLECRDLDDAIAIAKKFPALRVGAAVELRPHVADNECKD
jgi:hypothetical protein